MTLEDNEPKPIEPSPQTETITQPEPASALPGEPSEPAEVKHLESMKALFDSLDEPKPTAEEPTAEEPTVLEKILTVLQSLERKIDALSPAKTEPPVLGNPLQKSLNVRDFISLWEGDKSEPSKDFLDRVLGPSTLPEADRLKTLWECPPSVLAYFGSRYAPAPERPLSGFETKHLELLETIAKSVSQLKPVEATA